MCLFLVAEKIPFLGRLLKIFSPKAFVPPRLQGELQFARFEKELCKLKAGGLGGNERISGGLEGAKARVCKE